jgi:hypothetical protein
MALHMGGDLGVAVGELALEELDHPLDARARCHMRDAHALALGGDHLHELAPTQHQRLQPLQFGVGQRLDEALALGVLMEHPGKGRQHPRVQCVGLGERAHRAGEVARRARVDHRHRQAGGLDRAGGLELVAAGGLQHHQCRLRAGQLPQQLLDAHRIVADLPSLGLGAAGDLQRLAGNIDTHENRVGHVLSLPSLSMRTTSSYNRSGCKKGRSGSRAQCSGTGFRLQPRGVSGCVSRSEASR